MFKWPSGPSPRATEHELADFAELVCWQQGNTSATALTRLIGRLAENEYSGGVPEEEEIPQHVENAYSEIERRTEGCGDGYPFVLGYNGDMLHSISSVDRGKHAIYKYLLLATRLDMGSKPGSHRNHADIDGTRLFEDLSAETCREYFGDRAESMVFGKAAGGPDFEAKVNDLCDKIGEAMGAGYTSPYHYPRE